MNEKLVNKIDALLPQTQCGLCEYAGCRPYAEAMANKEAPINRCLPGGVETLISLAEFFNQDPTPHIPEMTTKAKPPAVAVIREDECIGCTKCIQACPTDAIIGAPKLMHTIISDACTGCELCLPPCPLDCIDIKLISLNSIEKKDRAAQWRRRYEKNQQRKRTAKNKITQPKGLIKETVEARRQAIQDSILRVQLKKKKNESS